MSGSSTEKGSVNEISDELDGTKTTVRETTVNGVVVSVERTEQKQLKDGEDGEDGEEIKVEDADRIDEQPSRDEL